MNFQDLKKIEEPDFYLDVAFSKAKKRADLVRASNNGRTRLDKSKNIELERLATAKNVMIDNFDKIVRGFPSLDNIPEFYKELIRATLDFGDIKQSLGSVNSSKQVIIDIHKKYSYKIKKTQELNKINEYKKEFYGRISSVPKRMKPELAYLETVRKIMKKYPAIKTEIPTIAIAGFPNVGKSTLLSKMTSSTPEINSYPFTTKGLNVGYADVGYLKFQMIDTPGTLDRFDKMNYIEKIAYLAMKYCAEKIIYVFDPTEEYPIKDQEKLLRRLHELDKKIIIYISKVEIADEKIVNDILAKHKGAITDYKKIQLVTPNQLKKKA